MGRKKHTIHYLYKTTCIITSRYYIGMHSTSNLDDGYMGSGKRLRHSIRKYGKENHIKEIHEFFETREELAKRETEIVCLELIQEELCMNLTIGGLGAGFMNDEHMFKCSKAGKLGYKEKLQNDEGFFQKISKQRSEITKKTHSEGKLKYDNFTGKQHSEETKKLMSDVKKGSGTGEYNSQYGTCWITKNGLNKKIKKEELESYLNKEWVKGRK